MITINPLRLLFDHVHRFVHPSGFVEHPTVSDDDRASGTKRNVRIVRRIVRFLRGVETSAFLSLLGARLALSLLGAYSEPTLSLWSINY